MGLIKHIIYFRNVNKNVFQTFNSVILMYEVMNYLYAK